MIDVRVKKLKPHAIIPTYANSSAAGIDAYSAEDYVILPGKRMLVSTGIAFALPEGYEMQVRPRSGLALKNGISIVNTPGTLDSDYRGELSIILINHGDADFVVSRGMRVAQLVVHKFEQVKFTEDHNLDSEQTKRGAGGFGSTGLH